jgi:hypothetical protein
MKNYELTVYFKQQPATRTFIITQAQFNAIAEMPDADWITVPEPLGVAMIRANEVSMITAREHFDSGIR